MEHLHSYLQALNPITASTWNQVSALFSKSTLRKGEFFVREGNQGTHIGFLQKGIVRAFYANEQGVEYNKHFFTAPSFIGAYASLISGQPGQINQEALSDCDVYIADFAALNALYDTCPDLERAARRLAELFFVQKEQKEIEIVLLDADKRYELFRQQFPGLEQSIAQYHIASYLGITPTQLSRIRKKGGSA